MQTERETEDAILAICRANTKGGTWVMRSGVQKQKACNVFNVGQGWHSILIAEGDTWEEVLNLLQKGQEK